MAEVMWAWVVECTTCDKQLKATNVFVDHDGYLVQMGLCPVCKEIVAGETFHIFDLMKMCYENEGEDGE